MGTFRPENPELLEVELPDIVGIIGIPEEIVGMDGTVLEVCSMGCGGP